MKHSDTPPLRKVVTLGDYGVVAGKYSLHIYMTTGEFVEVPFFRSTSENLSMHLTINGRPLELQLLNVPPQEEYDRIRPVGYPDAAVVVLAFAIDDPESFQNVADRWHPEIAHFCSTPTVPIVLVGCKSDVRERWNLAVDGSVQSEHVTKEQGYALATRIEAIAYLECSSRSGEGMEEVMKLIGETAISWDPLAERRRKRTCQIV